MDKQVGYDADKIKQLADRMDRMAAEAQSLTGELIDPNPAAGLPTDRAANQFRDALKQNMNSQQIEDFLQQLPEAVRVLAENLGIAAGQVEETAQQIADQARQLRDAVGE